MRKLSAAVATLALLAVTASAPRAHAEESPAEAEEAAMKPPSEGRDALNLTGSALVLGGGLALLPAAYVASTVAVGAIDSGSSGAESAAKDFQEPYVFAPLAAGFCALMIGAALLVVVKPPTSLPTHSKPGSHAVRNPFVFTF